MSGDSTHAPLARPALRVEDAALLRGRGRFVDDIALPGLLHASFVRSPVAHARLNGIDASAARALPGVRAVFTYRDLRPLIGRDRIPLALPVAAIRHHVDPSWLAETEMCFVGEPVAMVVAESRALAEDAASLVVLDYEELPAVTDPVAALAAGAPKARLDCADNLRCAVGAEVRRCRARLRARRAPDRAALPHPQGRRPCDRDPRRARALRRHRGAADGLGRHPDAAQGQARHRRHARLCGKPGARDRAPCRRRLRAEEPVLPGGAGGAGGGHAARRAGQVDRGSPRELHRHQPRARAGLGPRSRRRRRRQAARRARQGPSRPRLGDAVGPVDGAELRDQFSRSLCAARRSHIDFAVCLTNFAPATSSRGAGRPQGTYAMERLLDRIADASVATA